MNREELKAILDNEINAECKKKGKKIEGKIPGDEFNLLGSGVFDSLGILQLISRLEEESGVEVDLSDYSPAEFTDYDQLLTIFTDKKS